jgi:tRNA threonylcarbamoyl adenosine modification protein YjeE
MNADFILTRGQVEALAARLAARLRIGDCITLEGDLGSGKTTFVRALIRALSHADLAVASPTFTLVQPYLVRLADGGEATLWHADLYRLRKAEEIRELGFDEALEHGVLCIEWPEMAKAFLPQDRLAIAMDYGTQEGARRLSLTGTGRWQERLTSMTEDINREKRA